MTDTTFRKWRTFFFDRYMPVCERLFCREAFPQENGCHRLAAWPNNQAHHGLLLFCHMITCLQKASSRVVKGRVGAIRRKRVFIFWHSLGRRNKLTFDQT
jgi:hypothetical protein